MSNLKYYLEFKSFEIIFYLLSFDLKFIAITILFMCHDIIRYASTTILSYLMNIMGWINSIRRSVEYIIILTRVTQTIYIYSYIVVYTGLQYMRLLCPHSFINSIINLSFITILVIIITQCSIHLSLLMSFMNQHSYHNTLSWPQLVLGG